MKPGHIKEANAIVCELTNLLERLENDRANVTPEQYNDLRGKVVSTGIEAIATIYGKQVASVTHADDIVTLILQSTNTIGKELALLLARPTPTWRTNTATRLI